MDYSFGFHSCAPSLKAWPDVLCGHKLHLHLRVASGCAVVSHAAQCVRGAVGSSMLMVHMLTQGKPVVLDVVREAEQQIAGEHFMESAPASPRSPCISHASAT